MCHSCDHIVEGTFLADIWSELHNPRLVRLSQERTKSPRQCHVNAAIHILKPKRKYKIKTMKCTEEE